MKPGRKFIEEGAAACSDEEILAILIGSGGSNFTALDSARELLDHYGSLPDLMDKSLSDIAKIKGIKSIRAIRIGAAFELARRIVLYLERET